MSLPENMIHASIPRVLSRDAPGCSAPGGDDSAEVVERPAKKPRGRPMDPPHGWLDVHGGGNSNTLVSWRGLSKEEQDSIKRTFKQSDEHPMGGNGGGGGGGGGGGAGGSRRLVVPSLPSEGPVQRDQFTTEELNIMASFAAEDYLLLDSLTTRVASDGGELVPPTFAVKPWEELEKSKEDLQRWHKAASKTHILKVIENFAKHST